MLGVYRTYVGPMLIHVRLLDAMLGPYSSHVELMLSTESLYPAPKEHVVFGSCRDHAGRI